MIFNFYFDLQVARNLEENVEEVCPTDVQVVQPAQREQAAVVYPSTVVENESVVKSRFCFTFSHINFVLNQKF